jgi:hypothetical protein
MSRHDKHLDDGRDRRDAGVALASTPIERRLLIAQQQLELLDAIQRGGTSTTDDIVDDLAARHHDGGRWRGAVTLELARRRLIVRVGYAPSARPSRHGSPIAVWAAGSDAAAIRSHRVYLRRLIATLQSSDRNN